MKHFLYLLLIIITIPASGQEMLKGLILNADTKESIPYVNIGILNSNIGTVSDEEGVFQLKYNSTNDTILISSIGFETVNTDAQSLIENGEILLNPIDYKIEEIEITSFNFDKEVILGERNKKKRGHSFGFGNAQLGTELGALIKIDKETYIKSVNFTLNHAKGDSLLLRINIYDYSDKILGDKLVKENILIKDKQRKGLYTVDLSEYEIILKDHVLLTVEWLRDFDELGNKSITFDTKKSRNLKGTYIRYSSNGKFKRMMFDDNHKPCFYFVGKQSSK